MNIMNDEVRKWLENHKHELESEELLSEEEKMEAADVIWLAPEKVPNMGQFVQISSPDNFNRIVGDPNNWKEILEREDLYEKWVLPNAVCLFSKIWFDRVKWRSTIGRGIPFPLFSNDDKDYSSRFSIPLEKTSMGRAKILQVIEKTSYALKVYLAGKWYEKTNTIKPPGGYIIEAIKNDIVRDIGKDLGYRLHSVPACQCCLVKKRISYKTVLTKSDCNYFSCPKCIDLSDNLRLRTESLDIKSKEYGYNLLEYNTVKRFRHFHAASCICPNNKCVGRFVPISCLNDGLSNSEVVSWEKIIGTYDAIKGVGIFKAAPESLSDLPLKCPFCTTSFTPATAILKRSGFKDKSGYITGSPTIYIWGAPAESLESMSETHDFKNSIADENVIDIQDEIVSKQKLQVLIDEVTLRMTKLNTSEVGDLSTWYFYKAAINWMTYYWSDAIRYLFGGTNRERDMTDKEMLRYPGQNKKKVTDIPRGQIVAIHQSFFHLWMHLLNENIGRFTAIDSSITNLRDFQWFCRSPKFSFGPESTFVSEVDSRWRIANKTLITSNSPGGLKPRFAKVLAIYKSNGTNINHDYNYINDMKFCEWQSIRLKTDVELQPGDQVMVSAIMMPGHPTHAPIQRILRLRSKILAPIIERINYEEKSGNRDIDFWRERKKLVEEAEKVIGEE